MSGITKVGRVLVPVADQDEAIAFYTKRLGLELIADIPFGQGSRWVAVAPPDGGTSIALVPPQDDFKPPRRTGIGLETTDAKATRAELKEKGVDVDAELVGGDGTVPLLFFFRDHDENQLMVAEVD